MVKTAERRTEQTIDIWTLRREWIRQLLATREQFSLLPQHVRLIATDAQFAQMFRIPPNVRTLARSNKAFFVAIPVESGWVITLTDQPDFGGAKYSSILRDELRNLAVEIARLISDNSDDALLMQKQQLAYETYRLLPPGMQQEFAYLAPQNVMNARQGQTP
ncbi:MAG: hypothetical protein WC775_01515 [Patescibacteria group bacterium]|jgi:hypothetical protein